MVMFSATWPIEVHKLAEEYMDPNPVKVRIFIHKDILVIYLIFFSNSLKPLPFLKIIGFVSGGSWFRGFGCQP